MKVILTEKPQVARDIAKVLKINSKHDGFFEGGGYQVTWAFGHLLELQEPNDYKTEWQRWNLASLPMIPEQFELKVRGDAGAKKQLQTIKKLFKAADEIICATDAGREGELIFRYILTWTKCEQKPFKRLWISSLTDEAIRQGFAQLQNGHSFDGLYRAAKCRSESDWIVGMNATRLYTLKFGRHGSLWSIGRVQTPVLALIVKRDLEIAHFKPKDFWELHTLYRDTDFQYMGGRFSDKSEAEMLLQLVLGHELQITRVTGKQEQLLPPLLYDLTDLQKDMNLRFGMTAERSLSIAQSLYEKKHITYPRTDSRYLTTDIKPTIKPLLQVLSNQFAESIARLDLDAPALPARIFNDAKVSDHHAIIPTIVLPQALNSEEHNVFEAISLRFISVFYPACIKRVTTVLAQVAAIEFKTTGTVIEELGWQQLYKSVENNNTKEQKLLPLFVKGETGVHQPEIKQGQTKPPKTYTEASLLSSMESAGKSCDDDALKEALKDKGLGTPATRAAIIEVLIRRRYIERQKKNLLSTAVGQQLISLVKDERLKSAIMTGEWEAKLKKIERNEYDPERFMAEIIEFTTGIKDLTISPVIDVSRLGSCPLCGQSVITGKKGYGCSDWKQGCSFVLWQQEFGVTITHDMAAQLLQTGKTLHAYTIVLDDGSTRALLTLDGQGKLGYQLVAPDSDVENTIAPCPLCSGFIVETTKAYSCNQWRAGCSMTIWKLIANKVITRNIAEQLLKTGETELLTGFTSTKGAEFSAKLRLLQGKVVMDFN